MGDHVAVHQHAIRIVGIEQISVEGPVIIVNNGKPGTGSIGGHHSRDDHHPFPFIMGRGFGRIDGRTAAHADHYVDIFSPDHLPELFDFPYAGNPSEHFIMAMGLTVPKAFFQSVVTGPMAAPAADEQPVLPQILEIIVEFLQSSAALYIFQRCTHQTQSCHNDRPPQIQSLNVVFLDTDYTIDLSLLTIIIHL